MEATLDRPRKMKAPAKSGMRRTAAAAQAEAALPRRPVVAEPPAAAAAPQASAPQPEVAVQDRVALIAEAAYFIAERRGFAPGYEWEDWFAAEAEVMRSCVKR